MQNFYISTEWLNGPHTENVVQLISYDTRYTLVGSGGWRGVGGGEVTSYIWHSTDVCAKWLSIHAGYALKIFTRTSAHDLRDIQMTTNG